jgi:uncharacterized membrane-anchored protein YitT (DUF2179 family)
MLTIAGIINAIGVTIFLNPVKLYDSGISGTSMLIAQVTPDGISLSVCLLLLNIPLFLYGYKKQGREFTYNSIYTVLVYSIVAWMITDVLPVGGYSNMNKTVVYFVVNRFQVTKMKDIVKEIDPKAYITIAEVADVFAN